MLCSSDVELLTLACGYDPLRLNQYQLKAPCRVRNKTWRGEKYQDVHKKSTAPPSTAGNKLTICIPKREGSGEGLCCCRPLAPVPHNERKKNMYPYNYLTLSVVVVPCPRSNPCQKSVKLSSSRFKKGGRLVRSRFMFPSNKNTVPVTISSVTYIRTQQNRKNFLPRHTSPHLALTYGTRPPPPLPNPD